MFALPISVIYPEIARKNKSSTNHPTAPWSAAHGQPANDHRGASNNVRTDAIRLLVLEALAHLDLHNWHLDRWGPRSHSPVPPPCAHRLCGKSHLFQPSSAQVMAVGLVTPSHSSPDRARSGRRSRRRFVLNRSRHALHGMRDEAARKLIGRSGFLATNRWPIPTELATFRHSPACYAANESDNPG